MSEVEQLDEDALFDTAVSEETQDNPVVTEQVEQPVRDDAGRFAKKEEESAAGVVAEKPTIDDNAPHVPSWRVREINEEKRAALAELETLRAERTQWQQQQPIRQQPVERPVKPDPLLDPEGYAKSVRDEIREEMLADRREESLQRAAESNPDEFKEAYAAARQVVDPALKARMQSSRDPGKTLLEWHRENKVKAEVGGDPVAYRQRLRDEALKDPEFRKQAMAAWQNEAQTQSGRPLVDIPPSLNGVSRSNASLRASHQDLSDSALFEETTG